MTLVLTLKALQNACPYFVQSTFCERPSPTAQFFSQQHACAETKAKGEQVRFVSVKADVTPQGRFDLVALGLTKQSQTSQQNQGRLSASRSRCHAGGCVYNDDHNVTHVGRSPSRQQRDLKQGWSPDVIGIDHVCARQRRLETAC